MKRTLTIIAFVLMLAAFAVTVAMPPDYDSVLAENRNPSPKPEASFNNIFNGSFCSDFESYLSDSVGARGKLIAASEKIEGLSGIKSFGYIAGANADLGTGNTDLTKGLLVADEKIMEIFKANPEIRTQYIELVNYYAEKIPDGINIYNMIVPTQIEFQPEVYSSLADSQKETIDIIYSSLSPKVKTVDAYSALQQHKDEYIYFRTDHHWTTRGAYYAYTKFAECAGVGQTDIKNFTENRLEGFLGYLYNQAQATELKNKPDTIYFYENGNNYEGFAKAWEDGRVVDYKTKVFAVPEPGAEVKYSLFMGGDHSLLYIPTDCHNGRNILVVKDSYANAFLPWLVTGFEKVVVVDPRSFGGDVADVLTEYGITDVLLMNYSFSTTFSDITTLERGIYR